MSEHAETLRVTAEGDLPAVMDTLMAAFGYEAVKAAWLEASGGGDEVARLRDGIADIPCDCLFPGDRCPRCALLDGEADDV